MMNKNTNQVYHIRNATSPTPRLLAPSNMLSSTDAQSQRVFSAIGGLQIENLRHCLMSLCESSTENCEIVGNLVTGKESSKTNGSNVSSASIEPRNENSKSYSQKCNLDKHSRRKHPPSPLAKKSLKSYACGFCQRSFSTSKARFVSLSR